MVCLDPLAEDGGFVSSEEYPCPWTKNNQPRLWQDSTCKGLLSAWQQICAQSTPQSRDSQETPEPLAGLPWAGEEMLSIELRAMSCSVSDSEINYPVKYTSTGAALLDTFEVRPEGNTLVCQ